MQKITPFLWFDNQAEEAVQFYVSIFKDAKIGKTTRYTAAGPQPAGSVMTMSFTLQGQEFTALNGGPHFKFTEAVSFVVNCADQAEVDYFWEKLSAGGSEGQCGWLKDKFGLSWQVVPVDLLKMLSQSDPVAGKRVIQALMKMKKLDVGALEKAAKGD